MNHSHSAVLQGAPAATPSTTSDPWAAQRWALQTHRARVARRVSELRAEAAAALRRDNEDFWDAASEESDREVSLARLAAEERGLAEIDAALKRIEDGTYGICEATGKAIDPARLSAVPWTRYR